MKIIFFVFFLAIHDSMSQNFIPNGSFEEVVKCPIGVTKIGSKIPAMFWYSPSLATPDLFHSCSHDLNSVPENFMGISFPNSGNAYAGLCLFKIPERTYREYMAVKLVNKLTKGIKYNLDFYYKLASGSKLKIDSLQVCFIADSLHVKSNGIIVLPSRTKLLQVQIQNDEPGIWLRASLGFAATGAEQFFVIGNFAPDRIAQGDYDLILLGYSGQPKNENVAYYYFDDFELKPFITGDSLEIKRDQPFYLENVYFNHNSFLLTEYAAADLNDIVEYMLLHTKVQLIIRGHADKSGSEEYNLSLSLKRSQAIKDYLVAQGAHGENIQVEGLGKSKIVSPVDSLNRRVEFIFTSNSVDN